MPSRPPRLVALAAGLLVLALAGCDSGGDSGRPATSTSAGPVEHDAPAIAADWASGGSGHDLVGTWVGGGIVATVADDHVTGTDVATGRERYDVTLPGHPRVCAISTGLGGHGWGALLLDRGGADTPGREGTADNCRTIAVLDTTTGRLRWQHPVRTELIALDDLAVSVSAHVVTASFSCGDVRRLDLVSGRELASPLRADRGCSDHAVHDSRYLVTFDEPAPPSSADPGHTGFIPRSRRVADLSAYDADSGRRLWTRRVSAPGKVGQIVSDDPLVVDTTISDHHLIRVYGTDGRPGTILGPALPSTGGPVTVRLLGRVGRVDVLRIGDAVHGTGTYGIDAATGRTAWRAAPGELGVAVVDGRVLLIRSVDAADTSASWLTSVDAATGGGALMIGALGGATSDARLVGDHLLAIEADRVVSYPLPAPVGSASAFTSADDLVGRAADAAYTSGEVHDDATRTRPPCAAVSRSTLRELGFHSSGLPAPLDCGWYEGAEPPYTSRTLDVSTEIATPVTVAGTTATGTTTTATQRAEQDYRAAVDALTDSGTRHSTPVPALGDEAALVTGPARLAVDTGSRTQLVVRQANVIVEVDAESGADLAGLRAEVIPSQQVEQAAVDAATDVLGGLGLSTRTLGQAPGAARSTRPVCLTLAELVRNGLPGLARLDVTSRHQRGHRSSACDWEAADGRQELVATAYAVPGSVTGAEATEIADRLVGHGTPVPGLGDRAVVRSDFGADSGLLVLRARRGNVVVSVTYSDDGTLDEGPVSRLAVAAAREELRG